MKRPLRVALTMGAVALPLLVPATSFASIRNAGLIDGIWFSSNEPLEDTQDMLYAGVLNESGAPISGVVSFAADGLALGTTSFSIASDTISRVGISKSFKAGSHAISARITSVDDTGQVAYTELTERILVVQPKPTPPPVVATSTTSGESSSTGGHGVSGGGSGTILTVSSTTNTTVRSTASAVNAFGNGISSVTNPIITSVTTTRNAILGHTGSTTPQSSALDVVTPTKNLFDVSLDIAGQAGKHSMWDTIKAFLLSLLAWFLYCIIPIAGIVLIFFGFKWLSRRNHR